MAIHYLSSVSPRPRTVSDDEILAATARAMSRVPPTRFTLAESAQSALSMDASFAMVRETHASPLEALLTAATAMARFSATPEELANSIAYLHIDLSDAEFHKHILESSRAMQRGYRALLDQAIEARELTNCDSERLARAVEAVAAG